jgi:subtilisin-like proprotein convertase family protein
MYNLLGDPSMWIPEPGGGADLHVMPTGNLVAEGMVGGPFDPASITYNLGNNADVALDFSVTCDADWVDIDTTSGTIPVGGEIPVTVSFSANAESLPQGTYEADVEIFNLTTGDGDCLRHVTLHIGRTIITVDPGYGFETGGPIGGPFTGEQTYTITSERPTPVDVQVSCDVEWLAVNGSTDPFNATLVGVGDNVDAIVSISDAAESMEAGVYTGHVNFVNMTSGEGNTSREIILEVGRVVYAATDVPQPIDDYQVIESTIDVGDFYCVGDVNVDLDVTHTYIGDLSIDLIAPSGVIVRLHNRTGGSDEDIVTTYDEQGGTMPDGPGSLADFSYAGVNGTWTLRIEDHAGGDQGTLNAWALRIVPLGDTCPPVAYDMEITVSAVTPSEIELDAESIEGEPLDYTIVSLPMHATLADPNGGAIDTVPYTLLNGGNVVEIDPDNDYVGLDLFEFMVFDGQDSNVASVDVMIGGPQPVHVFDFETDPGWDIEGDWAFGQPTGGGTHNGDPVSGYTGNNVYGYNLAGDYTDNMPEYDLTTTAIDCSDMTEVEVRFWRWLGVESASYDHAEFQVSNNGSNWTTIWEHSGSSIGDTAWIAQAFDISAVADNQPTVYLKWVMGTTDGSVTYPGWNVDDVELWGIQPIELCPGDLDGDGMVGVEDLLTLLAAWGDPGGDADLNDDGLVEVSDLLILLAAWGACP